MAELAGSWRVALRIARRSTRRHCARSVLVLLMLFIPAYAGTVLAVAWANLGGTSAQETTFSMGRADVILDADDLDEVAASLPPGSHTVPMAQAQTVVQAAVGLRTHPYEATDAAHPLHRGRYVLRVGRPPQGPAEVALTRALASDLDAELGSQIQAGMPQRRLTVVGIVDWSRSLRASGLLVPADAPLSPTARATLLVQLPAGRHWSPSQVQMTRGSPGYVDRREAGPTAADRAVEAAAAALVTSFAGAQMVLLAAAAFLVGAHRQRRELAMVAAVGGTGRQVSRVVLASGLVLGAGAATTGALLGLLTFASAGRAIERIADHPLIDVSLPWWSLAAVAAVTASTGGAAATLAARSVRDRPVRDRLGGQRTRSRADIVGLASGVSLLAVGTAALVTFGNPHGRVDGLALGAIAQLLGLVACAPALLRIAGPVARRMPLSARLGLRHAARHRMRTGAAIAAVTAAVAGSVALALVGAARDEATPLRAEARTGQVVLPAEGASLLGPDGLRRFAAALPTREAVALQIATVTVPFQRPLPDGPTDPAQLAALDHRHIAVGGPAVIRLVTGRAATAEESAILDRGGAVVFNAALIDGDTVALPLNAAQPVPVPAVLADAGQTFVRLPAVVVGPATAQRLGLTLEPWWVIVDTTRTPSEREVAAANDVLLRAQLAAAQPPGSPITATVAKLTPPTGSTTLMFYLLAVISGLVTLVASAVAVGLATVELRSDLATMASVGATPRIQRQITATQAALIVGLGTALGLLAGIGPAAGYIGYSTEVHWHTPWRALLLIGLVPPVLATLVAAFVGRGARPLARLSR